jgi:hypothetical protein
MENTGEQVSTAFRSKALTLLWIPNDGEQGRTTYWRKGWDSNPRYPCRHAGFQDRCLKPLGHPSNPLKLFSYLRTSPGRKRPFTTALLLNVFGALVYGRAQHVVNSCRGAFLNAPH